MFIDAALVRETPVFYNSITGRVSDQINDTIDWGDVKISPEGLANYLKFGFSAFGQSPVENVKFLMPNETLDATTSQKILVSTRKFEPFWETNTQKGQPTFDELIDRLHSKAKSANVSQYILPLSGGLDSRILGIAHKDQNVKTYTYSNNENCMDDHEITFAAEVASKLGLKNEIILLAGFNSRIAQFIDDFGCSIHAHGMYHIEFYEKIRKLNEKATVLSGYLGDAFAGSKSNLKVSQPSDILKLGLSYGVSIPDHLIDASLNHASSNLLNNEFDQYAEFWNDPKFCTLYMCQLKSTLLSYLKTVPKNVGFDVQAPFMDNEIIKLQMRVANDEWIDRHWQKRALSKLSLLPEHSRKSNIHNTLDYDNIKGSTFTLLDEKLFSGVVVNGFIQEINKSLCGRKIDDILMITSKYRISRVLQNRLNISNKTLQAYYYYLILAPLVPVLEKAK
jgi:asparagine synthetase B (glutamine-hydrolysing)